MPARRIIPYGTIALLTAVAALAAALGISSVVSARDNVGSPVKAGTVNHTISVAGHGEVNVPPDEATLTLGVQTQSTSAQSALSENAARMQAVIAALQAQGVPANHIQTSDLSIWFDSEHNQYMVNHQVTARLDNVDKVGQALDAAVAAGANNSWGVTFGLRDMSAARSQAIQAAIADARKRADSMSSALGVKIDGVGSASEASYQVQPPIPYAASKPVQAGTGVQTPVQPGQLTVTADVNVVYTFS